MKTVANILVYILSLYTLFVFTIETLKSEFGVKVTRSFHVVDEILLIVGGFVLGIVLYIFKGRANKIFGTVMIIENVIVLFILLKYLN
jgi:hypothetical protein